MFAALLCLACHSEKTCTIRGTVTVPDAAQDYYAVLYQGGSSIDPCLIADGKFTLHAVQTSQQQLRVEIHDAQGKGRNPGKMRNVLADRPCGSSSVNLFIDPSIWGLSLQKYQVHARFILLDTVTGYRSQYHQQSFLIGL